jgi:hypothetical protein
MDSLLTAAARALAAGDALTALKHVALRDDAPAQALRGIAMAQLGDYPRSRELLRLAARGFGAREAMARARCVVAEAEVALAMRELAASPRMLNALEQAAATLDACGDETNAWQARLVAVRGCLLMGRLDEAAERLARVDVLRLPPLLAAVAGLAAAELSLRSLRTGQARDALLRAQQAAQRAQVPALQAEVSEAQAALDRPAARRLGAQGEALLRLSDVEALLASPTLVLDACRRGLSLDGRWLPLASRPVLFTLAQALAEAWPADVRREALIARAFRTRRPDETHRARLRVEIGRLRALAAGMATIEATAHGFQLQPAHGRPVVVMAPPIDGAQASLLALLADGAAWSTSALAVALGASQRTVQRALADLLTEDRVRCVGQGRARRWLAPPLSASAGFTTILLLPNALPFH